MALHSPGHREEEGNTHQIWANWADRCVIPLVLAWRQSIVRHWTGISYPLWGCWHPAISRQYHIISPHLPSPDMSSRDSRMRLVVDCWPTIVISQMSKPHPLLMGQVCTNDKFRSSPHQTSNLLQKMMFAQIRSWQVYIGFNAPSQKGCHTRTDSPKGTTCYVFRFYNVLIAFYPVLICSDLL